MFAFVSRELFIFVQSPIHLEQFNITRTIATKLHSFTASDLAQVDIDTWLELRSRLQKHHKARIEQYRFRRDPKGYLANLESRLL